MRHPVELSLAVAGVRAALIYHNGSRFWEAFAGEAGRFSDENKHKIIIIKMKSGRTSPLLMGGHLAGGRGRGRGPCSPPPSHMRASSGPRPAARCPLPVPTHSFGYCLRANSCSPYAINLDWFLIVIVKAFSRLLLHVMVCISVN